MRVDDLDWKNGYVRVIGKGDKERTIRLSPAVMRAINTYLRMRERNGVVSDWLWLGTHGRALSKSSITNMHNHLQKALGFSIHPHRWRHTFAQTCLDAGMDRESVRVLMGHEDLKTLQRYTRATDTRRALEAHRRFSPAEQLLRKKG